jgi:hypothetical protein
MTILINLDDLAREPKSPKDNPEKDADPEDTRPETEKDPHRHC